VLHVAEAHVRLDRAVDEPDRTVGRVLSYSVPAVTASGVVGKPTTASAERGADLLALLVDALADLLARARAERDPEL
jgi:creatinine amidohydrolase